MCSFQVLVETITFGDQLLPPLSESLFFDLNLLGETLPESLFLFLELGVVELSGLALAKLAGLHLLSAVNFVVLPVVFILDFGDTPAISSASDDAAIGSLHILLATDHGKWHSGLKY